MNAARADEFARVKVRLSALVASLDETVERGTRAEMARVREEAGALRRKLDIASAALIRLTTAAYPPEARVTASQALDAMDGERAAVTARQPHTREES
jgi:hypothetical protein